MGTSVVLIYSLYKSFSPFPAHPYNWSPFIVGGWLLIGIAILAILRARGHEQWLSRARGHQRAAGDGRRTAAPAARLGLTGGQPP